MTSSAMPTTAAVLARIDQAWTELERSVQALDARQLAEIRDPAGWAAKDHLIHLIAWEQALVARLDGRPEHEALGIDETLAREGDEDAVNAAIFARHRDRPLGDVLEAVRSAHAATRARLAALRDADLAPMGPEGAGGPGPVLTWVEGNTWAHYAQHLDWMRELVRRA